MIPSQEWMRLVSAQDGKPVVVHLPNVTMMASRDESVEGTIIWFGHAHTIVRESLDDIMSNIGLRR